MFECQGMANHRPIVRPLYPHAFHQLESTEDQEHANVRSRKIFTRKIYKRVMDTYIIGRQIDIDEYLVIDTPAEATLADSMAYAIDALKETLCRIWPYAADIK